MASLAPHVSRVSKEYAPYGYSIYTDVVVDLYAPDSASQAFVVNDTVSDFTLMASTDSDIYIESVTLICENTIVADGTDKWSFMVDYKSATGGAGANLFAHAVETEDKLITGYVPYVMIPDQNQLVPQDRCVTITCTRGGSSVTMSRPKIQIRYRRKA
jgi:hypothetical protein